MTLLYKYCFVSLSLCTIQNYWNLLIVYITYFIFRFDPFLLDAPWVRDRSNFGSRVCSVHILELSIKRSLSLTFELTAPTQNRRVDEKREARPF